MRSIAVIPARGGSKRLPGKNLALLGGKPLINWSIEIAYACPIFEKVVVTTDNDEIAEVAEAAGAEVWRRAAYLARDETPMLPVIKDVSYQYPADIYVTLQPTSPFRRIEDIIAAHDLLTTTKADSVFSITDAPDDLAFAVGHAMRLRKLPDVVVPNGALFLITNDALERGESWFSGCAYGYSMPKDKSLDIDTPLDLEIAKIILQQGKAA